MSTQHLEPLAVGGGGSHGVAGGPVGIYSSLGGSRVDSKRCEGGKDVDIAESGQAFAGGTAGVESRQALLGIATMLLHVPGDESGDHISVVGVKISTGHQMIGHGAAFVAGPGLKGRDELDLVDQTILKRDQAEEQVLRWVDCRRHDRQLPIGKSQRFTGSRTR